MAVSFVITVDKSQLDARLNEVARKISDVRPVLTHWATEEGAERGKKWNEMSFGRLYASAAMFLGEIPWQKVPPMRVRKNGGRVPPFGGVPRIALGMRKVAGTMVKMKRITGNVLGRKRKSGARLKASDVVGKDTHTMYKQFVREPRMAQDGKSIDLVTVTSYAVHQEKLRSFAGKTRAATDRLFRLYTEYLRTILKAIA